jgi:ribonucleoside-diphosphate reductase alpha chain
MSVMMKDMLTTYKMGWKTSYYQNTYDFKGEEDNHQPAGLEDTKVDTNTNGATMTNGTNGHTNGVNGHSNGETETIADDSEHCDACAI